MMAFRIAAVAGLALTTAGCVGSALPSGTLVQPGGPVVFAPPPPPPPVYAPRPYYEPVRRCFWQDGPFGPERVCRY